VPIRKPTLLCIDDDPQCLTVRRILFEAFGFQVVTSINPRQGLRLHQTKRFDAAIIDYQMPGMNGAQLSLEMKRLRPDVPVMILSGLPQLPVGTRAQFDSFVCKGGPSFKLVKEVQKLVDAAKPSDGDHLSISKRIFAAAGVAIGFATEGAAEMRQRWLPHRKPIQSPKTRVASRSLVSTSAPHLRAV
jgi:CheY-like chemotaxis protein